MRIKKNGLINIVVFILFFCVLLSGCDHKKKSKAISKTQVIVAKMESPVEKLFYTGTLFPIGTIGVDAPVAGNITSIDFNYGERVIKDQVLAILHSKQLSDDYRKSVDDFLHKKQTFSTNQKAFEAEQALYNAGVVSQNEYASTKTTLEDSALDFLQSKFQLQKVLYTANVDPEHIESLSLSDTKAVNLLLQRRFRRVEVIAPASGIALFPTEKNSSDSGESPGSGSSGKLLQGSNVKDGQLLLQIGDLSGLSASFNVSEVDIDRIKKGMKVLVTGNAFPGQTLNGFIDAVSSQANQGSSESGLSTFQVKIKIPNLDKKIVDAIRVGMTAKFEIDIESAPRIMLPVNAVTDDNGKSVVTILDAQGKTKTVPVITGITTPTQIVVVSGVKEGDKIVVPEEVER